MHLIQPDNNYRNIEMNPYKDESNTSDKKRNKTGSTGFRTTRATPHSSDRDDVQTSKPLWYLVYLRSIKYNLIIQ